MMHLSDAQLIVNVMTEASSKLSFVIGQPVELQIVRPVLPPLTEQEIIIKRIDKELLKIRICQLVCEHFMISQAQIQSKDRSQPLTDARKIATYLLFNYVDGMSDKEIGAILNFDRTTSFYNRKTAEQLINTDKQFQFHYSELLTAIKKVFQDHD